MMHSVPSHIVRKVADYAHRKASYSLMDYLEELMKYDISEEEAFRYYRQEFFDAIINVLDGNAQKWELSCLAPTLPLAGLAVGLKRRGYADGTLSLSPLLLRVNINGLEFSFQNGGAGKVFSAGDFVQFEVKKWKESYLDFLEVLEQQSRIENLRGHFEKITFAYRKTRIAKDIMRNAAHKIVEKVLDGEKYQIMLTGVNEGLITFWIDTRWGEIKINSPFETFEEALTLVVSEMKESEADDWNNKKLMRKA